MFGLNWPLPEQLNDEQLYAYLFPQDSGVRTLKRPTPDLQWIHKELKRKGVTLLLLWFRACLKKRRDYQLTANPV